MKEIVAIFPEVSYLDYAPNTAAYVPLGKMQKKLIYRHKKNCKPVIS